MSVRDIEREGEGEDGEGGETRRTQAYARTHTRTHAHTRAHTHIQTHACTHTHTHTHTKKKEHLRVPEIEGQGEHSAIHIS